MDFASRLDELINEALEAGVSRDDVIGELDIKQLAMSEEDDEADDD